MAQSYQQVSKVILRELMENSVDFRKTNIQKYFYNLKDKTPKNYERIFFDKNGHEPYSKDLSFILDDFKNCGFTDSDDKIISESNPEIEDFLKRE